MKLSSYIFICIILTVVSVITLADTEVNTVAKQCLRDNGYKPELFGTYNFSPASSCLHEFIAEKKKQEDQELREFLKANPRYTDPGPQCYIVYSSYSIPYKKCIKG